MKSLFVLALGCVLTTPVDAADTRIVGFNKSGVVTVQNVFSNGVLTVEKAASPLGPWLSEKSTYALSTTAPVQISPPDSTSFYRALTVDLSGTTNSWILTSSEILDLSSLAARFLQGADNVSEELGFNFSSDTWNLLNSYGGGPDPELAAALTGEFNAIIQGGPWFDPGLFAGVHLSPSTQELVSRSPTGAELERLNRQLLEDAYPSELFQKRTVGFLNLASCYGLLTTVAGSGNILCSACNSWLPEYEGLPATQAALSSPHIAMADKAGNIYIADKRAHAIRKVTLDGTIHTVAGTGVSGLGTSEPSDATTVALFNPNGIFVFGDGLFYILDRDNGLIRRVDTNGIMTTIVNHGGPIAGGRGIWVSPDESWLVYSAESELKHWDKTNGLTTLASGFSQLGNVAMDPKGRLVVTDAGANLVTRLEPDGTKTIIAGNGFSSGGGDGFLAIDTAVAQVRGIWFLPTGAYFLTTDGGSQVWYVDLDAHIHMFMNGDAGGSYSGDGAWFYNDPQAHKVSQVKEITADADGNLLVTESDRGYIRKVNFSRLQP